MAFIPSRLCYVTSDEVPDPLGQIKTACDAGIRWVQLRMKTAGPALFRETALAAKEICCEYGALLTINDRALIAAEIGADGLHVGLLDLPVSEARQLVGDKVIIGGTANTIEDIRGHAAQGADYIGLGPFRFTNTKKNLSPVLGTEGYRQIISRLKKEQILIPILAIGGITAEDIPGLMRAGVDGIAFSGLLLRATDRSAAVRELEELTKNNSYADNR